jgi:hypothetical protein
MSKTRIATVLTDKNNTEANGAEWRMSGLELGPSSNAPHAAHETL